MHLTWRWTPTKLDRLIAKNRLGLVEVTRVANYDKITNSLSEGTEEFKLNHSIDMVVQYILFDPTFL